MGGCTVSVCNQPTRSTQPCIPLGFAKSISSWKCWGKGRNVSSAGWQVTLCDTTWHVSSRRTLRTALHSLVYLLAAFYSKHKASVWCLSVHSSVSYCAYTQSESQGGISIHTASVHFDLHHIHTGQAPQYLSDCVSTVSSLSGRYQLRSTGSTDYVLPRTRTRFGERGFSYCGPAAWNTLLTSTTLLTPAHSENDSRVYFLIVLTTDYCWRSWTCRIAAPYKYHVD